MRSFGLALVGAFLCTTSFAAQDPSVADNAFAAALHNIRQGTSCSADRRIVAVAQRTIGGAPIGYRAFVERFFGSVIADELLQSYGTDGPGPHTIDEGTADQFPVLPLEQFETGAFAYDWPRINEKYPQVRFIVRVSWPAVDRLGTYAVVRYELIGRDRPAKFELSLPFEHASFVKFEKQPDGTWKPTIHEMGAIWK